MTREYLLCRKQWGTLRRKEIRKSEWREIEVYDGTMTFEYDGGSGLKREREGGGWRVERGEWRVENESRKEVEEMQIVYTTNRRGVV
jgi:hypothetical protein